MPQGSVLLVTEHGIQEGKLVEQGTVNLPAFAVLTLGLMNLDVCCVGLVNITTLQEVMNSQTLAYRFPFSQFSFPTDISCIILTEGKKSAFYKVGLSGVPSAVSTLLTDIFNEDGYRHTAESRYSIVKLVVQIGV